jgi:tRNA(Ile)-lysidine synthase
VALVSIFIFENNMSYKEKVIQTVKNFIKHNNLIAENDTVLCAVSGGADSIVMASVLIELNYKIAIAHCNFKLRGKQADKDEQLVKKFADNYELSFHSTLFETEVYAQQHKISIQMAARELRYEWFEQLRKEFNYSVIATAHHLNDQIETVLLNLTKGTGLKGIKGIQHKKGNIIRPILQLKKEEIFKYAEKEKLKFRTDASNNDNKYERNLIRNKVVPILKTINPSLLNTFEANINHIIDANELAAYATNSLKKKLIENRKGNYFISINKLLLQPGRKTLLDSLLTDFDFSHKQVEEVFKIIEAQSGKQVEGDTYTVIKDRNFLIITQTIASENNNPIVLIENEKKKIKTPEFQLKLEVVKFKGIQHKSAEWFTQLDYDKIQFPLVLRKWKRGDYFYPLGMNKKKKVSNYLVDEKVSLLEKEKICVLISGEHIIALLGKRIDDRFKVTSNTKKSLELVIKYIHK